MAIQTRQLKFQGGSLKVLLTMLIIICVSCTGKAKNETQAKLDAIRSVEDYPVKIVQQGLQRWYDKTKWNLYCIYCDDTCLFEKKTNINDTVTFASLSLKFEDIKQFNDTTEINFYFYYHDTIKCDFRIVRNLELATGAGFKKGSDSIYYYTSPTTAARFWERGSKSRYENPLQPEVIAYINSNKEKLYPWFREEAKKRGVLR